MRGGCDDGSCFHGFDLCRGESFGEDVDPFVEVGVVGDILGAAVGLARACYVDSQSWWAFWLVRGGCGDIVESIWGGGGRCCGFRCRNPDQSDKASLMADIELDWPPAGVGRGWNPARSFMGRRSPRDDDIAPRNSRGPVDKEVFEEVGGEGHALIGGMVETSYGFLVVFAES